MNSLYNCLVGATMVLPEEEIKIPGQFGLLAGRLSDCFFLSFSIVRDGPSVCP